MPIVLAPAFENVFIIINCPRDDIIPNKMSSNNIGSEIGCHEKGNINPHNAILINHSATSC